MLKICVFLVAFAALLSQGHAGLKCYVCESKSEKDDCFNPKKSGMVLTDCTDKDDNNLGKNVVNATLINQEIKVTQVCLMIKTRGNHKNMTIIRTCSERPEDAVKNKKCLGFETVQEKDKVEFCEVCHSDACNAAEPRGTMSSLLAASTMLLIVLHL